MAILASKYRSKSLDGAALLQKARKSDGSGLCSGRKLAHMGNKPARIGFPRTLQPCPTP